jgi:hypothetical protein
MASWYFYPTPEPAFSDDVLKVVSIDCKEGINLHGDPELIRVTMVDYFSGCTVFDRLVYPDVPMRSFETDTTGVEGVALEAARYRGKCILGRANARKAVWEHVGPRTLVLMHSGHLKCIALRWMHPRVIDTRVLEREPGKVGPSLEQVALKRLGRSIRGHGECVESALAVRDIAHFHAQQKERERRRCPGWLNMW